MRMFISEKRYKGRTVCMGNQQIVPFASKTAPAVKNQTVRVALALAAKWNLSVNAADLSAGYFGKINTN